ncbi:MAG: hypothetical protein KDJ52_01775 [Anaerolineae bacterium]|nr:hypothetical protein [Anaerolineae bacterium]
MSKVIAIKNTIKIAPFVAPYTLGLRQGRNERYFTGWCPFHQPSKGLRRQFWVDSRMGLCNCFNPRCAAPLPMDVINFYARVKGIALHEAIEELWEQVK